MKARIGMGTPTQIDVRVIAKDGKFLGDDIGGALVTIHDVATGELLARGQPQIYEITVSAFQQKTGNTGVDKATVIIPVSPAAHAEQS